MRSVQHRGEIMLRRSMFLVAISFLALSLSAMAYPLPHKRQKGEPGNPVPMPEPSSMVLAGTGLVGLVSAIRRKARG
jgi:PEP-CTERM motif